MSNLQDNFNPQFNSWNEFVRYGRQKYYELNDVEKWFKLIFSYAESNPMINENLCIGIPGIWCVHEDDEKYDCFTCLSEEISKVKKMFGIS